MNSMLLLEKITFARTSSSSFETPLHYPHRVTIYSLSFVRFLSSFRIGPTLVRAQTTLSRLTLNEFIALIILLSRN